ncbi:MAG TPA: carboxypeptidase regulatory-like domain-containing protein [Pyrinomonadaceae bacterium]
MKQFLSLFFIGLLTLFISSSASAQQAGSLTGQVVDTLGAVVVGASVTAVDAGGKEKSVVTNRQGEYTITGLAPGKYTIRTTAPTFQSYENTEVEIAAGQRQELVIALVAAGIEETVEVGNDGQVNTDADNNAGATVLKDKDLDALPDDPDELEAALQALAGPSSGPNGGQFYIDGFTGGRLPPKESIREIRINQNPFSAEYERLGFGRIEILTKPGSDKWRGSAFFNFNDESLNSRNPFAINRASSQTRFFGGNVSGPIQKGKSSFFLDVSNRDIRNAALVNALVLDPSLAIIPFQQEFTVPTSRLSISPRFDYQINTNNTLVARYSFTRNRSENQGISGFNLPSRAFETSNTSHEFRLTETMILNPKTINETRFQYEWQKREQLGDNSIPTVQVAGSFNGGGAQIGQNFTDDRRWELSNYTTTSLGKNNAHAVKFGFRVRGVTIKDRSESGFGGTYTFTGFFDDNGTPNIPGDDRFVSSIEQYRQRVLGNPDPRYNPNQFSITTGEPLADISQLDIGLFVTDDWRVRPDLTLSFGLRYENQTNIGDKMNFAPRFSFAWSPGAGGARQPKTVFRGGFGLFYDRFSENYSLQAERFDGTRQLQFIVQDNSPVLSQPVFTANGSVINPITAAQLAALGPQLGRISRVSEDLQSPYTMQLALGVERQLPMRTTLSAFFIASRNVHVLRFRNVNAPVCGFTNDCPTNAAQLQALRPNPSLGNIYQYESSGFLNSRQLIVNFNSRLNPNFTLFGNYRLGWAKGDAEGGGFFGGGGVGFPAYSYDLSNEYGRSPLGVRHNVFIGGNFTLPWKVRLSPFIIASSGVPFNITRGVDLNGDSVTTERPTFAELAARCQERGLTNSFCDINGQDPNAVIPRNYGRGPGSFNVNLNVSRTFGFGGSSRTTANNQQTDQQAGGGGNRGGGLGGVGGGRGGRGGGGGGRGGRTTGVSDSPYNLTLGIQFSNLLNRNNRGIPVGNLSSRSFGESLSTGGAFGFFGGGGSSSGNRRVELQARFSW